MWLLTGLFVLSSPSMSRPVPFDSLEDHIDSRYPIKLNFQSPGASSAAQSVFFQDKLIALAKYYAGLVHVPYIWGGGRIGSVTQCEDCRLCVQKNSIPLTDRLDRCTACRQCGMDCSHFVYKMYQDAGLDYNYASSRELSRQTPSGLLKHYNMVDIGNDLTLAQPGDLLVYKKHIMMLLRVISPRRGDFIHVTRFGRGDSHKLGGIRFEKDRDLERFRGSLVRILRHKRFFEDPNNFSMLSPLQLNTINRNVAKR
jgi:hypothetical protein